MAEELPHASIRFWAVLECRDGEARTRHIVGYVVAHDRLSSDGENRGEPYIGRSLASLDLAAGRARNERGKLIHLLGESLPAGETEDLPADLKAMLVRAGHAWRLASPIWARVA